MVLLTGSDCQRQSQFEKLIKGYTFKALLGVSSDTYDPLGVATISPVSPDCLKEAAQHATRIISSEWTGVQQQPYPPYSAICLRNHPPDTLSIRKPLWWWTKEGRLSEITIPSKEIKIISSEVIIGPIQWILLSEWLPLVIQKIERIEGDFRQAEIIKRWSKFLEENPNMILPEITGKITVSSGTYIRSLINQLGKDLGCGAIASDIYRTRVGSYHLEEPL